MENKDYSLVTTQEQISSVSAFSIDYKRVLFKALRFWYLVLFSLLVGLAVAFLANRYTTKIYPVTTSILIRESEERIEASLIYNNPLANPYRNFYNEVFIIKSFPLIQSVVEELNFHITIQREGNIKNTELYNTLPFSVTAISASEEITNTEFSIEFIDHETFKCIGTSSAGEDAVLHFKDTVTCQGNRWLMRVSGDMTKVIGERYLIKIRKPVDVAASYIERLLIDWAEVGSSVVNLSITGPVPLKEIDFLKKLTAKYEQYDLNKKKLAAIRTITFIDDQLIKISDSLSYFEHLLERFKSQNALADLGAEAQRIFQQIETVDQKRAGTEVSQRYYTYLEDYLKNNKLIDQIILPTSLGITDPLLNSLISQLVLLQTDLRTQGFSDNRNPLVQDQLRKIDEARKNILESIRNLRGTDAIQTTALNEQIGKLEKQLRLLPEAERKLVSIRRNYTLSENLYLFMMQKRAEAGISQASTTSDIITVNPPMRAGKFITPKILQNYIGFGGIGLILPFLTFLLLEVFNNKIQSREDLEKITNIPFIGGIGHKQISSNLVVFERPKSGMAESFRAIRSNLNYFTESTAHKVFLITSSVSGEGKTFTTTNLATVFALSGKKTIILGADLRRPKLFEDFNIQKEVGLSNYLSGMATANEIIYPTGIENLSVIAGGPVPPNPSELVMNDRMGELIRGLVVDFDYVLIDTPPIAIITDGLVLSKFADHILYIVRQNYTDRLAIKGADEFYRSGKLTKMSLVLNDISKSGPGYGYGYRYGYSYGYGYGYNYSNPYYDDDKKS